MASHAWLEEAEVIKIVATKVRLPNRLSITVDSLYWHSISEMTGIIMAQSNT